MAKISTHYFESIIDADTPAWEKTRQRPETQTQCLAAIVVLLAELVDIESEKNERERTGIIS